MMDVPLVIIEEIYNLLCLHDESPKMGKELFIDWYSRGQLYKYVAECKTVNFHCKAPFFCYVTGDSEKAVELNRILSDMSARFTKILAFW